MTAAPVKQARIALGARLRELRTDAKLTGRALAAMHGWHFTKVSKIENGATNPSSDDIRAWCRSCNADDQLADLLATTRAIETMYVEWQRQMRAGLKHQQREPVPLYERTQLFRIYENTVLPGLFHTAEYSHAILTWWNEFLDLSSNVDEAVAVRMERQRILYNGTRRFVVLIEEQALYTRVGGADIMLGQLDRLLATMSLPRVSLGVIPRDAQRYCLAQGSFWIFDEERVQVESISAGLDITQPREVSVHMKAFQLLQRSAVHGSAARQLVSRAATRAAQSGEDTEESQS